MTLGEALELRARLHALTVGLDEVKRMAVEAEALWSEAGDPAPVTLFTDDERAQFLALQAKAELRRDQLDARTVGA